MKLKETKNSIDSSLALAIYKLLFDIMDAGFCITGKDPKHVVPEDGKNVIMAYESGDHSEIHSLTYFNT